MFNTFQQLTLNQYEASLSTLNRCLVRCPEEMWNAPVARFPFCQTLFHALFFTDYYLETSPETMQRQSYHQENPDFFGDYEQLERREPVSVYERADLASYLQFCRDKASVVIQRETEDDLLAPAQFPRKDFTRAELHVYNIRHVQHHAAQLILKLRLDSNVDIPWFRSGWQD